MLFYLGIAYFYLGISIFYLGIRFFYQSILLLHHDIAHFTTMIREQLISAVKKIYPSALYKRPSAAEGHVTADLHFDLW